MGVMAAIQHSVSVGLTMDFANIVFQVQSKEWFQEQLQFAQDARSKLQQDLASAQAQVKTQSKAVENLKAENAQVRLKNV